MILVVPGVPDVVEPTPDDGVVPGPVPPVRNRLRLSWHAPWLDRVWDLTDCEAPVYRVNGTVHNGRVDGAHWLDAAARIPGARWGGYQTPEGHETHVVALEAPDTETFAVVHDEFLSSLDEDQVGRLRWTRPDGSWRELTCRYESGAGANGWEGDPYYECRALYPLVWLAADPFWHGPPEEAEFKYYAGTDSPPGSTPGGPEFVFAPSNVLGEGTVRNPGDVPTSGVWRIDGPFTAFSVDVGDAAAAMTLTKTLGQWVDIDMNPQRLTVVDESGVDQWEALTAVDFAGIPPGESQVVTTVTGAAAGTRVQLSFTPKYRRGW